MPSYKPVAERFAEKYVINPVTGCWDWTGMKIKGGYGMIGDERPDPGEKPKNILAHRLSFRIHRGYLPEDLLIRHTCDNNGCVNPEHLVEGTHQDNMDDMADRGRRVGRGAGTTLPPEKMEKFKKLLDTGATQMEIAKILGIHRTTVQRTIYRDNMEARRPKKQLSPDERFAVLRRLRQDTANVSEIAREFGVDRKTIRNIRENGPL